MKQFNFSTFSSKASLLLFTLFLPTFLFSQPTSTQCRNAVGYLPWDINFSGNFNPESNIPFDGYDFGLQSAMELDNALVGVNEVDEPAVGASLFFSVHLQSDPPGPYTEIPLSPDPDFVPDGLCTVQYKESDLAFNILSGLPDGDYFISKYWEALLADGTSLSDGSAASPLQAAVQIGNTDAPPCIDQFETEGQALFDFADQPIPSDFFGPGSEPFIGQVILQGAPIDPSSTADTYIERLGPLVFPDPTPQTVPIEIVELKLVGSQPIIVDGEPWLVEMGLSDQPQQQGQLQAVKNQPNGGEYNTLLPVLPRFVFVKEDDPTDVRVWDYGLEGIPPIDLNSFPAPWSSLPPLCEPSGCQNFFPTIDPSSGPGNLTHLHPQFEQTLRLASSAASFFDLTPLLTDSIPVCIDGLPPGEPVVRTVKLPPEALDISYLIRAILEDGTEVSLPLIDHPGIPPEAPFDELFVSEVLAAIAAISDSFFDITIEAFETGTGGCPPDVQPDPIGYQIARSADVIAQALLTGPNCLPSPDLSEVAARVEGISPGTHVEYLLTALTSPPVVLPSVERVADDVIDELLLSDFEDELAAVNEAEFALEVLIQTTDPNGCSSAEPVPPVELDFVRAAQATLEALLTGPNCLPSPDPTEDAVRADGVTPDSRLEYLLTKITGPPVVLPTVVHDSVPGPTDELKLSEVEEFLETLEEVAMTIRVEMQATDANGCTYIASPPVELEFVRAAEATLQALLTGPNCLPSPDPDEDAVRADGLSPQSTAEYILTKLTGPPVVLPPIIHDDVDGPTDELKVSEIEEVLEAFNEAIIAVQVEMKVTDANGCTYIAPPVDLEFEKALDVELEALLPGPLCIDGLPPGEPVVRTVKIPPEGLDLSYLIRAILGDGTVVPLPLTEHPGIPPGTPFDELTADELLAAMAAIADSFFDIEIQAFEPTPNGCEPAVQPDPIGFTVIRQPELLAPTLLVANPFCLPVFPLPPDPILESQFNVDSFFDISYQITVEGESGTIQTGTVERLNNAPGTGTDLLLLSEIEFLLTGVDSFFDVFFEITIVDVNGCISVVQSTAIQFGKDGDNDGWCSFEDCNDANPNINPGAQEVCNGLDDDCDGDIDDADSSNATNRWYEDFDDDGYGDANVFLDQCDQPTGYVDNDDDCNDLDEFINPLAQEVCNGIDDDCDGDVDDADPSNATDRWYEDFDDDGYGDANVFLDQCDQPTGYVDNDDDCNDLDELINPGAQEVCNGLDDDCDGDIDDDDSDNDTNRWYEDFDDDGYGDANVFLDQCDQPTGYVDNDDDCNDLDEFINPAAQEVCNGLDDDCDSDIDDADPSNATDRWYEDFDDDGYGDANVFLDQCPQPPGYVDNDDDCDDLNELINPDADEVCDNDLDDDCDGDIDEDCLDCTVFETAPTDLTKSFDPVNGIQDRVQVKWFKTSPEVRYSDEDAAACDIKFWPKRNLDPVTGNATGDPIVAAPEDTTNILNTKKFQPDGVTPREIFKWPVKFRADGANNNKRADPNIRYQWQVRCACDHGAGPESPWSVVKIFNTPDFDPSTGIYTPPTDAASQFDIFKSAEQGRLEVYPNPNDGSSLTYRLPFDVQKDTKSNIQVMDMTGKIIFNEMIVGQGKTRVLEFERRLNDGMYMIQIICDGEMLSERFIVQ